MERFADSDAVTLERKRVNENDKLLLYQAKTRQPVYVAFTSASGGSARPCPRVQDRIACFFLE
jgi:hypothetical protein